MTTQIDRRSLLTGIAVSGCVAAMAPQLLAASLKPFFQRVGLPIGLQLYTLGDEPRKDLDATFARLAAIGYRDIELPNLYGLPATQIKSSADRAGLTLSCIHLAGSGRFDPAGVNLESDVSKIADTLGGLGLNQAVMPLMLLPDGFNPQAGEAFQTALARGLAEGGEDIWKRTAALLNEKAAALKPFGISLGYHNHNVEFAPVGKTNGWQILVRETDPKLVSFEVDVGWLSAAGVDPVAFLKRHRGRVRQLHVKDIMASTKTNFALAMDPTEVGSGKLDWGRILPAAYKAGVRNFYVEQEAPFTISRMDAAAKSYKYLEKLRG